MTSAGWYSSGAKCRIATSISATGLLKSSTSRVAGSDKIALGVAEVRLDVGGAALGRGGEQGPGVGEHERVVVDVDDPGGRGDALRDLVHVVRGRQAGADVEELRDRPPRPARYLTARPRNARFSRAAVCTCGECLSTSLAVFLSAAKWFFPPMK